MQDRYAGDIGDYVKFAILRALSPGRQLAVAWWLHPDSGPPGNGRHTPYLDRPGLWRHLDPPVFDALRAIVSSGHRQVAALEAANLLPDAIWFSERIPTAPPWQDRAVRRAAWFGRLLETSKTCDLVFADPDNGLAPGTFDPGKTRAAKSVSLAELRALARPGRALIVYHHQTRNNGTHIEEIGKWADRLRSVGFTAVDALRAGSGSARAFFLLDADDDLKRRAEELSLRWGKALTWHPGGAMPPA